MYTCAVKPSCTIPDSGIIEFDADTDIDGIGFIAAFYTASFLTVIVLTATYITSDPSTFTNFGFCKLDELLVSSLQKFGRNIAVRFSIKVRLRTKENFYESLRKAILVLSDQQLLTGIAMGIAGLVKHCEITQYHFSTVINLVLAASVAHSMTFSFIEHYIFQNSFFRIWRAIAMLLLGTLCFGIWVVTGNNNWLWVYGLPAQCGYDNLGDGFGPPALVSLGMLYWFLIRGYAYSFTVLIPASTKLQIFSAVLSTTFWIAQICKYLAAISEYFDWQQAKCRTSIAQDPGLVVVSLSYPHFKKTVHRLRYGAWSLASIFTKLLHALVYGMGQVWSSYGFALCWGYYTLAGSAHLIVLQRKAAAEKGMRGNDNRWGYGQLLSVLLLAPLITALINPFFDNPKLEDFDSASVKSLGGSQDQISTPLEEVGATATETYDPPEQGPLSRQSTASLRDKQRVLHAEEMETKLWHSWVFIFYPVLVND